MGGVVGDGNLLCIVIIIESGEIVFSVDWRTLERFEMY
jgi:hypothetical protein